MKSVKNNFASFLTCALLAAAPLTSTSASFDCTKASMPSEKIICSSPALSKLDDQMFAAYSKARSESANSDQLKSEQIKWIKEVRACGSNEVCVLELYNKRISELAPQSINATTDKVISVTQQVTGQTETASIQQSQTLPTEAAANESVSQQETAEPKEQAANNSISPETKISEESDQDYGSLAVAFVLVAVLLYLASFTLYIKSPKHRSIAFASPFDLGVETDKNDVTRSKRQWTEFRLFIYSIFVYAISFGVILFIVMANGYELPESDVASGAVLIGYCLLSFLIANGIYVLSRKSAGSATSCPACKTPFARKLLNSHREPRTTFEKQQTGNSNYILLMETGVEHSDYSCVVCSHSWHEAEQYTRQIGGRKT